MPNTYKLVLYCDTFPTLKNSKQFRFNRNSKRLFISASDEWAAWYKESALKTNAWKANCKYPLPFKRCSITIICFFPNMRQHDLDGICSGVLDLLKTPRKRKNGQSLPNEKGCGVIQDDDWKLLRPITLDAGFSHKTPRIEIFITPVEDISIREK